MTQSPIFIGGLAHSGKTPMRLYLSRLPNLAFTRRTYMWNRFYNRYGDLSVPGNFERCLADMLKTKGIKALQPDIERIRREFGQGQRSYGRLFGLFHEQNAEREGKLRWGDQLGFVERFAEPIFAAYPQAKVIHMIRDPRDTHDVAIALSRCRKGKLGWETARWLDSANLVHNNQSLYSDNYKVVRYETFRDNPEQTLCEVCEFLGEDFTPDLIANYDIEINDHEEENVDNSRKLADIQIEKIGKGCLSQRDLMFIQRYTKEHMLALDYSLESPNLTLSDQILFYFVDWPTNRLGMAAWYVSEARARTKNLRD